MKSIMQEKDGTCYLCMKYRGDYSTMITQEHHVVFGTANRKQSEKYGLKVYLCPMHHLASGCADAVHRNKTTKLYLCKEAQKAFEREHPTLSFMDIFGINYLDDEERQQNAKGQQDMGFIPCDYGW